MRRSGAGVERSTWSDVGRVALGLIGALVNAFAAVAVIVGAIAQSVRDQENGPADAWVFHVGYVLLNGAAMYFLLATLSDERRPILPIVVVWATGTALLLGLYWTWVL